MVQDNDQKLGGAQAELADARPTGAPLDCALAARKKSHLRRHRGIDERAQEKLVRLTEEHTDKEKRVATPRAEAAEE